MPEYGDKEQYTEATQEQELRTAIHDAAAKAVNHGVDRDWANAWLRKLGAEPVTGSSEYRLNVEITGLLGVTVNASSRAEAANIFKRRLADLGGKVNDCHHRGYNIYNIQVVSDAANPTFHSGPEDPAETDEPVPALGALKSLIRAMLTEGVAVQGWGYRFAQQALRNMDLAELPPRTYRDIEVPVSGSAKLSVRVFEGATDEEMQQHIAAYLRRSGAVAIIPEEIGVAQVTSEPELLEDLY